MAPLHLCKYYHVLNSLVLSIQSCLEAGHPIKINMQHNSVVQFIVCAALMRVSVWNIIRGNDATDIFLIIHAISLSIDGTILGRVPDS